MSNKEIEFSIRQASKTADYFLHKAITNIDEQLECGYAKKHPELIAAYMKIASKHDKSP